MTGTFELAGHTVRVPVPDGWEAERVDGRVRVRRGAQDTLPQTTVDVAIRPGADARDTLESELADLVLRLTDFTVLHLEPRPARAENWPGVPPEVPFVFAGYRQGVYSVLMEVGVVAGDGTSTALAFSLCLAEEAAANQEDVDTILGGIEVEWH